MLNYKKAVEFSPKWTTAWIYLADNYAKLKSYNLAVASYQKAILIDAKSVEAYYGLGLAYVNLGNNAAARRQYDILKTLDAAKAEKLLGFIK